MNTEQQDNAPQPEPQPDQEAVARSVGEALREARERTGLSVRSVAGDLKITATQLNALEAGAWDRLGAPVYVRGYLKSYGRLVDVDVSAAADWRHAGGVEPLEKSPLSVHNRIPSRALRRSQRLASTVIATALVAVPVVFIVMQAFEGSLFDGGAPAGAGAGDSVSVPVPQAQGETDGTVTVPMIASMTGLTARRDAPPVEDRTAAPGLFEQGFEKAPRSGADAAPATEAGTASADTHLELTLSEEVWMDVRNGAGERLAYGLKAAGESFRFPLASGIEARIGNAHAVTATLDGRRFDLEPHISQDIARFTLAGNGEGAPADGT